MNPIRKNIIFRKNAVDSPLNLQGLKLWLDSSNEKDGGVKSGNAAQFVAANSEYLSIADNAALSMGDIDFSMSGWFFLDSLGVYTIAGKYSGIAGTLEYQVLYESGLIFRVSNNGTAVTSLTSLLGALSTGTWYLFVVWHDATANTLNLQINNGTIDSVSYTTGVFDGTQAFEVGAQNGGATHNGRIQYLAVWKRILTASEKTFLYNSGNGRRFSELGIAGTDGSNLIAGASNGVAWWELGEESGTRADSWGSNTLTDNATVTQNDGVSLKDPVNNDYVRQWTDLSGNGNHATKSGNVTTKPQYITAAVNGKPVIRFGTNDVLDTPSFAFGTHTIFIVAKADTSGIFYERASADYVYGSTSDSIQTARGANISGKDLSIGWGVNANYRILTKYFDGTHVGHKLYINGTEQTLSDAVGRTADPGTGTSSAVMNIGNRFDGSLAITGDEAEFIVYDRALNATELKRVFHYLGRKFGISVP